MKTKRVYSCILAICMVLSMSITCFADEPTTAFDPNTAFRGLNDYEYDRFDDVWAYHDSAVKHFSDADITLDFCVFGMYNDPLVIFVLAGIVDPSTDKKVYNVNKLDFLIGENHYTFDSAVEMGETAGFMIPKEYFTFIEDFNATPQSNIDFRITAAKGLLGTEYKFDFNGNDFLYFSNLKFFCELMCRLRIDEYFVADETVQQTYRDQCHMVLNGKSVEIK